MDIWGKWVFDDEIANNAWHYLPQTKKEELDMPTDNKQNLQYFESSSMRGLFQSMDNWQRENHKRLLSVNIQKDAKNFCCIALTNPSEVVLTDTDGIALQIWHGRLAVEPFS